MKTISRVHSPKERLEMRQAGERLALRSRWRLVAYTSMLRLAVTRLLPAAGASGWWLCAACLVPALVLYWLCCLALRVTRTATLTECVRTVFGKGGVWALSALVGAALVVDAAASMTALITLFTEGIGSRGTQVTMALLTAAVLLACLNRDGLTRGVYFLRLPLLALLALVAFNWLNLARLDHVFPVLGQGRDTNLAALQAGAGLGWPLLLPLLEEPPASSRRWAAPLPPVLLLLGSAVLITLTAPHELLLQTPGLAESMLLTTSFLWPAVELVAICLWMVGMFLHTGSAVRMAADSLFAPTGREIAWLPHGLIALLAATQWLEIRSLWQALGQIEPWLALPLALGCAAGIAALIKHMAGRKRP